MRSTLALRLIPILFLAPIGFLGLDAGDLQAQTWTDVGVGSDEYYAVVYLDASNAAAVGEGFAYSTNGGSSWTAGSFGSGKKYFAMAFTASTIIAVGGSGQIARSTNNGVNWTESTKGGKQHKQRGQLEHGPYRWRRKKAVRAGSGRVQRRRGGRKRRDCPEQRYRG